MALMDDLRRRLRPRSGGTTGNRLSVAPDLTVLADEGVDLDHRASRLDDTTWVVRGRGRRRRVRRIGSPAARTHLVLHEPSARAHAGSVQTSLERYLADQLLADALHRLQVRCVLDVGANRGQFGKLLRRIGYTGRIVSFEPVSEFAAELEDVSRDDPDWHVRRYAVGEEDGSAEINVTPGANLSSLLDSSEFGRSWSTKLEHTVKETIQVRRLDGLIDDALDGIDDPRPFLKLDTQGFDLPAFRSAGERIREVVGVQSEVACVPIYDGMPTLAEQLGAYAAEGFEVAGMYPVSRHDRTMRVIEFDAIMVRPEAVQPR